MEVEEVDVTLELSVAPEEMAEFDSDVDDDAGVDPPSSMGCSIIASSNGLPHPPTGGAGRIRVRMETGAKFGLEHMLAISSAAAPEIAEKYECILCQPGKYFLEAELKRHVATPRHLKSALQLVDLKAYNECQFSEDSSELRKRLSKLLPSKPLSAIQGPVSPEKVPGIQQQIKNAIAAKKAKVRDDFIKQLDSSNQQGFSSTTSENSEEQIPKAAHQAIRTSPRIAARTSGRSVFDRLSEPSNDSPKASTANSSLAMADTPIKDASDSVDSLDDLAKGTISSSKTSFDQPATLHKAGHLKTDPPTASQLPKSPSIKTPHNVQEETCVDPVKRNNKLWSSRLEAPNSQLTTTSDTVNLELHNSSAVLETSPIEQEAEKMKASQLSPVQVPEDVTPSTRPESSLYPVFQPGSSEGSSAFDHVVIVGQIAIVKNAFTWGIDSSDWITFLELDCLQLEKHMPQLLELMEHLPSKTLWLFPGDVSMLTPLVPGTSPNSLGTSIKCKLCKDPATQAYEFHVPNALSKNDVTALVNKLSLELASFRKKLPREADVLLTLPAPHMITCITNNRLSHFKFHEFLPMPSVRFCTFPFLKVLNLTTTFLNGWSDIIRRTLISHRLGAIMKKHYCDMNSLRFHRAEVLSQETLDKTAYNRSAWLRMIWNIINASLGNEKQVLSVLPSKDPLQRQFFPPIRPASADVLGNLPVNDGPSEHVLPMAPSTGTSDGDSDTTAKAQTSIDSTDSVSTIQHNASLQTAFTPSTASDSSSADPANVKASANSVELSTITISNINTSLPVELVKKMASACGQLTSLVIVPENGTGRATATFSSSASAAQAARLFARLTVGDKKLMVNAEDESVPSRSLCSNDMKVRSNISWALRNAKKSFFWVNSAPNIPVAASPAAVGQPGKLGKDTPSKMNEKRERSPDTNVKDGGANHDQSTETKKMRMDPDSVGKDLKPINGKQKAPVFNSNQGSTSAVVPKLERMDVTDMMDVSGEPELKKSKLGELSPRSWSGRVSSVLPFSRPVSTISADAGQGKNSSHREASTAVSASGRLGSALSISGRLGTLALLKPSAAAATIINPEVKKSSVSMPKPLVAAAAITSPGVKKSSVPLFNPLAASATIANPEVKKSSVPLLKPLAAATAIINPEVMKRPVSMLKPLAVAATITNPEVKIRYDRTRTERESWFLREKDKNSSAMVGGVASSQLATTISGKNDTPLPQSSIRSLPPVATSSRKTSSKTSSEADAVAADSPPRKSGCGRMSSALPPSLLRQLQPAQLKPVQPQKTSPTPPPLTRAPAPKKNPPSLSLRCSKSNALVQKFIGELTVASAVPNKITRKAAGEWLLYFSPEIARVMAKLLDGLRLVDAMLAAESILQPTEQCSSAPANSEIEVTLKQLVHKTVERYNQKVSESIKCEFFGAIDVNNYKRDFCKKSCLLLKCYKIHNESEKRRDFNKHKYGPERCPPNECDKTKTCKHSRTDNERALHPSLFQRVVCTRLTPSGACCNPQPCVAVHPGSPDMFYHPAWEDLFLAGLEKSFLFLAGAIRTHFKLSDTPKQGPRILFLTSSVDVAKQAASIIDAVATNARLKVSPMNSGAGNILLGTPEGVAHLPLQSVSALILDDAPALLCDPVHALHTARLVTRMRQIRLKSAGRLHVVLVAGSLDLAVLRKAKQVFAGHRFRHGFTISGTLDAPHELSVDLVTVPDIPRDVREEALKSPEPLPDEPPQLMPSPGPMSAAENVPPTSDEPVMAFAPPPREPVVLQSKFVNTEVPVPNSTFGCNDQAERAQFNPNQPLKGPYYQQPPLHQPQSGSYFPEPHRNQAQGGPHFPKTHPNQPQSGLYFSKPYPNQPQSGPHFQQAHADQPLSGPHLQQPPPKNRLPNTMVSILKPQQTSSNKGQQRVESKVPTNSGRYHDWKSQLLQLKQKTPSESTPVPKPVPPPSQQDWKSTLAQKIAGKHTKNPKPVFPPQQRAWKSSVAGNLEDLVKSPVAPTFWDEERKIVLQEPDYLQKENMSSGVAKKAFKSRWDLSMEGAPVQALPLSTNLQEPPTHGGTWKQLQQSDLAKPVTQVQLSEAKFVKELLPPIFGTQASHGSNELDQYSQSKQARQGFPGGQQQSLNKQKLWGGQQSQWNGGQGEHCKGDQSGQWKGDQSGQWKGDQSGQWKGDQSGQWKGDQSGQWKGDQSGQWKGDQSGQWKGDQSGQWKGDQSGQWKGDQSGQWKGDQSGQWKGDQSGQWKGDQSGQWKGDQSGQWKGDQSGQWKGDQSGQCKGDQSGQWKGDQSGQLKGDQSGQWKGDQSGQWKGDQSGQWKGDQSGQWKEDQAGQWKGDQSGQWKGDQSGQWKGDQSGQWKGDQSGQWKGDQSGQWKGDQSEQWKGDQSGQWKGDQSGQGKGDQSGQGKGDQSGQGKGDQSGQGKGDQSGQWKGDQSGQWKGDQSGQWKEDQSGQWKGDQSGQWKGDQSEQWKGDQSGQWKGDQSGQWKGDQSGQLNGGQWEQWKGDQSGQWKGDQSGQWKEDQSGQWKGDQSGQWKGDQSGQWKGDQSGQWKGDQSGQWKGDQSGQLKGVESGQWKGDESGQSKGGQSGQVERDPLAVWKGAKVDGKAGDDSQQWYPGQEKWSKSKAQEEWKISEQRVMSKDQIVLSAREQQPERKAPALPGAQPWSGNGPKHWGQSQAPPETTRHQWHGGDGDARVGQSGVRGATHLPPNKTDPVDSNALNSGITHSGSISSINSASTRLNQALNVPPPNFTKTGPPSMFPQQTSFSGYNRSESSTSAAYDAKVTHSLSKVSAAQVPDALANYAEPRRQALGHTDYDERESESAAAASDIPLQPTHRGRSNNYSFYGQTQKLSPITNQGLKTGQTLAQKALSSLSGYNASPAPSTQSLSSVVKAATHSEEPQHFPPPSLQVCSSETTISSLFNVPETVASPVPHVFDVEEAYSVLERLAPSLDVLTPALNALIAVARRRGSNTLHAYKLFVDKEHVNLMNICLDNFREQVSTASAAYAAQLQRGIQLAQKLLEQSRMEVLGEAAGKTKHSLNMDLIASATLGKEQSEIADYIRGAALYTGVTSLTSRDVSELLIKVLCRQQEMRQSAAGKYKNIKDAVLSAMML